MPPNVDKSVINHFFDMLHLNMNSLQRYLLRVGDKTTLDQLEKMQNGLFAPMREMRTYLEISYDPENTPDQEPPKPETA
jgi:hypothetical protein